MISPQAAEMASRPGAGASGGPGEVPLTLVASSTRSNCTKMRTAWSAGKPGSVASKMSTLRGEGVRVGGRKYKQRAE